MLNNCIIMGRLTADPELRHTNSGVACCSFTLAVERDGKPNEQTGQRAADFIDCTAWRNTAEFIYDRSWRQRAGADAPAAV